MSLSPDFERDFRSLEQAMTAPRPTPSACRSGGATERPGMVMNPPLVAAGGSTVREFDESVSVGENGQPPEPTPGGSEPSTRSDHSDRAWGEFLAKYRPLFVSWAIRFGADSSAAEDAVQRALLRLFLHLRKGNRVEKPEEYIRIVILNAVRGEWKSRPPDPLPIGGDIDPCDSSPSPEKVLARDDAVRRAIDRLNKVRREVITLRYIDGLSYREIVEQLGVTKDVVRMNLHYARRELAEILAPDFKWN